MLWIARAKKIIDFARPGLLPSARFCSEGTGAPPDPRIIESMMISIVFLGGGSEVLEEVGGCGAFALPPKSLKTF